MSYQALARQYRPNSLTQVVGQSHVVEALVYALTNNRLHHAYLFSGIRGTGKTSLARILTKCLNCQTGVTPTPCEKCQCCQAISNGNFLDLIEIDGASRTKVEQARELIENCIYTPQLGRYKVYLIDEVHMLSNASFNALLKTIEEPPEHVKFIFATTHPQKILPTVLSRCLHFTLKRLEIPQIQEKINAILTEQNIPFEQPATQQIALLADGSLRDALSLLDQAIAYCKKKTLTKAQIRSMLDLSGSEHVYAILQALLKQDAKKMLDITQQCYEYGSDLDELLNHIMSTLHQAYLDHVTHCKNDVTSLFTQPALMLEYYETAAKYKAHIQMAPTAKIGLDMILLKIMRSTQTAVIPPKDVKNTPKNTRIDEKNTQSIAPKSKQPLAYWAQLLQENEEKIAPGLLLIAKNMTPTSWTKQCIVLQIHERYRLMLSDKMQTQFKNTLHEIAPNIQEIKIIFTEKNTKTPFAESVQKAQKQDAELEENIKKDPQIQDIQSSLNAVILKIEKKQP